MVRYNKYVIVVNPKLYNESNPKEKYKSAKPHTIDAKC